MISSTWKGDYTQQVDNREAQLVVQHPNIYIYIYIYPPVLSGVPQDTCVCF